VDALGTLKDPDTGDALAHALRDPDCGVRWKAAEALGKLGVGALPQLISALEDPAPDVRWRAALALGETGQVEAIPALTGALSDPDPYVRGRAVVALSGFGDPAFKYLYQEVKKGQIPMNAGVIRAFGRMGDPGLSLLGDLLREQSMEESLFSPLEEAFLDQGPRSAPILTDILAGANDPLLRVMVVRTLGRLEDTGVLDALRQSLTSDSDETVRREAERAIRRLNGIPGPDSK
jgi:HEAT repeat protein